MLTKVILDGKFGEIVGQREWHLDCSSPAEALALIEANKPVIKNWIKKNIKQYSFCEVECESQAGNKESLTNDTYSMKRQCKTIRFMPIFTGSGGSNGGLQAVLGVAMIVVGAIVSCIPGGQPLGGAIIAGGIGMFIGAICTMLMSPSKDEDGKDSGTSYFFNGAANTTQQGVPVPLVFGRCRVGSAVISSAIDVREG